MKPNPSTGSGRTWWKFWEKSRNHLGPALRVLIGKPFSALELVERDLEAEARHPDGATWFKVAPGKLYPAMLRHIEEVLELRQAQLAAHSVDGALVPLWNAANALPRDAWQWARLPKHKCPETYAPFRVRALEIARLWFTELLHREHSGILHPAEGQAMKPMGIHLLRDDDWKL